MHGPLSEIGLADVLQLLERGRRSGVLRVVGPDPTMPRTLQLLDGRITALEPDAGDAAVATGLAVRGLATLDPASPLDGPGALPPGVRDGLRRRLATRALASMIHWTRGRFDFAEHPVDAGAISLSPDRVMFDVVDAEARRDDLAAFTADFHAVPDLASVDTVAGGEPVDLGVLDWRILDAVDGVHDVRAIATLLGEALEDVGERVRDLVASAILELRQPLAEEARVAIDAGRYEQAVTLLRARITAVPQDGDAWRALGLAEVGAGRFDRAVEAWTAWQGIAPSQHDEASALIAAARTMIDALREP